MIFFLSKKTYNEIDKILINKEDAIILRISKFKVIRQNGLFNGQVIINANKAFREWRFTTELPLQEFYYLFSLSPILLKQILQ